MADPTFLPYNDADAAALTGLMRELAAAAGADPGLTLDAVRGWFSHGVVRDPAADTRLVWAGGELVAAALLSPPADGGELIDAFGGVVPGWRGRGLGRELMAWTFERASQLRVADAPHVAWSVDADAYSTEPEAFRLFARFGMQPVRYWYEMAASLSAGPPSSRPLPDGVRIVPFSQERTAALHAAHTEAMSDAVDFEPSETDAWAADELNRPGFRPDLTRLAVAAGEVVAYVVAGDETPGRVRMEEVGTRRAWRGRGLASALLHEVMASAAAAGSTMATLGVDSSSPTGAVRVYQRAGFAVVSSWVSYRRSVD